MPTDIVPPMYTMLLEEIRWALEEKEPYEFTHYLIWSKVYHEVASQLDAEAEERPKKKSKANKNGTSETFHFHPEDEVLQKHAAAFGSFDYETKPDEGASDARRVFSEAGIKPMGHLMLIEAEKFEGAVKAITEYLKPQS
jgi:protein BCP1